MVVATDILKLILYTMPLKIVVSRVLENEDGTFSVFTCNTLHARKGMVVDGIGEILDFTLNRELVFESFDVSVKEFDLPRIGFHSGTLMDVDGERGTAKRVQGQLTPFLWVREPYQEEMIMDKASSNLMIARLTMYIMDACNPTEFTDVIKTEVINPMRNLMEYYISQLEKRSDLIGKLPNYTVIGRNKAGVEGANGNERNLFDENLSGCEVRIDLTFKKKCLNCVKVEDPLYFQLNYIENNYA
jgi:hypothetical protein